MADGHGLTSLTFFKHFYVTAYYSTVWMYHDYLSISLLWEEVGSSVSEKLIAPQCTL